jgi:hypothetical protein
MIIKIKKRDLIIVFCIILIIPIVFAAQKTQYFTVTVSMTNRGPTIFYVNTTNVTLTAGTTVAINITFNVSDGDGFTDLDDSTAQVNVTFNGVTRTSSGCAPNDYDTNYTQYNCEITFYYYDNASTSWIVNATVTDSSSNKTTNDSQRLQVKELSSMVLVGNLTFTSLALGQQDATPTSDFVLNNTGNFDFTAVNITAYDLVGETTPGDKIGVGNFTVNISNAVAGGGMQLQNQTSLNISGATLPHRISDTDTRANETLYFWLDVPSGITVQDYNSTPNWAIIVE